VAALVARVEMYARMDKRKKYSYRYVRFKM